MRGALLLALGALVLVPAASAERSHAGYPSSIVALGDSGSTGYNSGRPGVDTEANAWSTGDNPAVQSHYLRILAANPRIRGHNLNYAVDGSRMRDLIRQARTAAGLKPDYVTIEMGGNDFCRTDETPLPALRSQLVAALRELGRGAPNARVLVVGLQRFGPLIAVIKKIPEAREAWSDGGPCDPRFDSAGEPDPARVALVEQKVQAVNDQLAAGCGAFIHCRYDGGSLGSIDVEASDLSSDWGHASIQGLTKVAAATWKATFDFTDRVPPVSKATRAGRTVTLTAVDDVGVSGLEYKLAAKSPWARYAKPVTLPKGKTLTWRAVDVNGNCEATHSLKG